MQTAREIQDWLVTHVAELLEVDPATIDIREPFSGYGLSSLDMVTLSGDLEEALGRRLPPTLAYDYPNILTLARHLAGDMEKVGIAVAEKPSADPLSEPIAIIGMGCRFPGANNPESFWQLLRDGIDAIREVPPDRWRKESFYHPDPAVPGKSVSQWGGFLDGIDQFDPFFFGISPVEAKNMDPQQRLLLELSFEALDDAGQTKANLDGTKTGVFVGISVNEYTPLQFSDSSRISAHSATGSALSIAANRISYFYNFHGPSMAIDTACSSSLAAVHLACRSLRNGECNMALAGGVNLVLSPAHSIAFTKAGVLAPDGRCKTFDARADGYVRSEGGGLVVLKPLSRALADGDPVQAVILGSTMAHDGRTNGLIAPSREAQESLLREAYQDAGIAPASVQYVEAHGTGTLLGDSMEAQALGAVMGEGRPNGPCIIGSVKTNIGHLEAAAGVAGLIKAVLSLRHRTLPPSLHYHSPNPHIPFEELHLRVNTEVGPWPASDGPALAGVSSFGFGGTNVHMIVQEFVPAEQAGDSEEIITDDSAATYLLPLSANSYDSLQSLAGAVGELLTNDPSASTSDLCYAAGARRGQHHHRLAAFGNSREELSAGLQAFVRGEQSPYLLLGDEARERQPRLTFVFPGQGGQWYGMGRDLFEQEPVFRATLERVDHVVQAQFGWSLLSEFNSNPQESRFDEIDVIQPILFAIQVALSELWQSWGITPDAVVGHSMGEVAAAHIAGILDLEDAVRIICQRSQLMKPFRGQGRMLLTELSLEQTTELLRQYDNTVNIAVINSPASTVLSGNSEVVQKIMGVLQQQNVFCKLVNVDVASHSPQMDGLRTVLLEALKDLHPQSPELPFYSTVTGARGDDLSYDAHYWMDNLRKPVLFSKAVENLFDSGYSTFIEIGPHPILLGAIQQTLQAYRSTASLLPSMRREESDREVMLRTLAELYIKGFEINWSQLYPARGKYVHLPLPPWQHQRYWLEVKSAGSNSLWGGSQDNGRNPHPLLGNRISLAKDPSSFVWQAEIDPGELRFLEDHRMDKAILFPAAAYIEMAWQSLAEAGLQGSHELADFTFDEKMVFREGQSRSVQSVLLPGENGRFSFSIYSRMTTAEDWIRHASGTFLPKDAAGNWKIRTDISPALIRQECTAQLTGEEFYQALQLRGVQYGPDFRAVRQVWSKENEALGRILLPGSLQNDQDLYQIHPACLDACLQVLAATRGALLENNLYLPTGCSRIRFLARPSQQLWSQVSLRTEADSGADVISADLRLLDENDQLVAEFMDLNLQRTARAQRPSSREDTWLYHLRWEAQEMVEGLPATVPEERQWLIFADDIGLGEVLAKELEEAGDHCHLLSCREMVQELEKTGEEAISTIIEQRLQEIPSSLYGVVHLWSLAIPPAGTEVAQKMEQLGSDSVLYLVQALARRLAASPRLWLVTRGAQSVHSGEPVAVEQSPLWGLGKVISFELPELKCIRIDLDAQQSVGEALPLLQHQLALDDREDQIAFRRGKRYVLRLLPFTFGASSCPATVSLRSDSSYLITGGLGGLGLETAKWMARRGARHLVLLGRSEPSAAAKIELDRLQEKGVEITLARADVSKALQLAAVFENIEKNMPPLRGVIHAAGVLDDGSLLNLNGERMKKVMAPKVDGTWNLHLATRELPLDFFVLYSSAVSVLGSPGQGNYAAASSYQDAMAHYRRHLGLPALSINWGPWAEVGLAAETIERLGEESASTQHLIKVIRIEDGLATLEQLLTESVPQVMALPFDLKNLIELYPTAAGMPFLAAVGGDDTHVARLYARPNLRQQYVAPRNPLERKLAELWQQTLHIDRVGIHDSFFELGGDSVLAAQILGLAHKTFGIRINPQDAFQAFNIERLAEMLEAEILSQLEEMSEEEAQRRLSKRN